MATEKEAARKGELKTEKTRGILVNRLIESANILLWKEGERFDDYLLAKTRNATNPAITYITHGYARFLLQVGEAPIPNYDIIKRTAYAGGAIFYDVICRVDGIKRVTGLVEDVHYRDSEEAPDVFSPAEIAAFRDVYGIQEPKISPAFLRRLSFELQTSVPLT